MFRANPYFRGDDDSLLKLELVYLLFLLKVVEREELIRMQVAYVLCSSTVSS